MKLLITTLTFMFISFGVKAHSLNGVYECRFNSWSPFKTEVVVSNFEKIMHEGEHITTTSDIEIDGVKYSGKWRHFIEKTNKRKVWIDLRHNDDRSKWNGKEGVKYVVQEKEFSEKTGSKWVTKRSVFCEPQ